MPVKDENVRVSRLKHCQKRWHDRTPLKMAPPSYQEIKKAIEEMRNDNAPGAHSICAELLKAEECLTPAILLKIFNEIWISKERTEEWKTRLIIGLAKNGDLSDCNNWMSITLLRLSSKVFSKIILGRLTTALEMEICKEQACFREGKSCSAHFYFYVARNSLVRIRHALLWCSIAAMPNLSNLYRFYLWTNRD